MNERLTALCEEAFTEVWESRKGPDGLVRTDGNPYIFYEKFAEVIVRECCDIFVELRTRPADLAVKDVRKHFGVEE